MNRKDELKESLFGEVLVETSLTRGLCIFQGDLKDVQHMVMSKAIDY